MTNFSDTQRILLSTAARRENGSLLPLPTRLKPYGTTVKAMAALITRGHAEEREVGDPALTHRTECNLSYGVFVTSAGLKAIGIAAEPEPSAEPIAPAPATAPARQSKVATALALLVREQGATLPELIDATGWLPHTTRASLSGLRKKGHEVTRGKRDGATFYRVASRCREPA